MELDYARWGKNGKRYGNLCEQIRRLIPVIQGGGRDAECPFRQ